MCQANLQPRVGRERRKVSGQFMKSDGLAGGEVVSEGSADQRCHGRKNTLVLQVVNPRRHNAVLIENTTCYRRTGKRRKNKMCSGTDGVYK